MNQGASTSQNNCAEKQKHHLSRWVNIPEQWVNIKQNGGSTWIRIYTVDSSLCVNAVVLQAMDDSITQQIIFFFVDTGLYG